jgi:hypothetical protein
VLEVDSPESATSLSRPRATLCSWLRPWELPLVLAVIGLVAGFLRFYQISTTEFDEDQAMLFRMAQDAVHHGLLPTTSNVASIGIANPPAVIYLFMPIALFSADPVWCAILVGVCTTAAALLTYLFTRRYYGFLAGFIAALLYATAAKPLIYARFIWQPNLMPPFIVLFLFSLFLGVVERRTGWLWLALGLFGVLYQMHPTTILLALPLCVAIILSPATVRWRDAALAIVVLLFLFFPYLVWEFFTNFADLRTIFSFAKQHAHIDNQALLFYRYFLSPYDLYPTYPTSVLRFVAPWIDWLHYVVPLLALGAFAVAGVHLFRPRKALRSANRQTSALPVHRLYPQWWQRFRADPYRCGLLVLLAWQIGPLLILSRHAVDLHAQYFFMLMPGPFILVGLLIARLVKASQHLLARPVSAYRRVAAYAIRSGLLVLVALIIVAQFVGSMAMVIDASSGNFNDRGFQPYPYHNALSSLQHALREADQVAEHYHLKRVYITSDAATQTALRYLAYQMRTPTTLFDASRCLVLPSPASGLAVLLMGPYDTLANALLEQFASFKVIDKPARLGGSPFSLYLVTSKISPVGHMQLPAVFSRHLQLLDEHAQVLQRSDASWLVTRWSLLRSEQSAFRTTYNYDLRAYTSAGSMRESLCTFTSLHAGDQLLVAFARPAGNGTIPSVAVQATFFASVPYNPSYGPFHLETDKDQITSSVALFTPEGSKSIVVPMA